MNTMFPAVTVLMSVYNNLDYLKEALESVLCQTFTDFEFLIIDDRSTDGSFELIKEYNDPRIVLIQNDNNIGLAASLNKGLALSRGKYIARMDGDDVCMPERLQEQINYLESHQNISIAGSWILIIDKNGKTLETRKRKFNDRIHYFLSLLHGCHWLSHPSVMFRKHDVLEAGGYNTDYSSAQDYDLWICMAVAGYDARIIQKPLLMYRYHASQISEINKERQRANKVKAHYNMVNSFVDNRKACILAPFLCRDKRFWIYLTDTDIDKIMDGISNLCNLISIRISLSKVENKKLRKMFARFILDQACNANYYGKTYFSILLYKFVLKMEPCVLLSLSGFLWMLSFLRKNRNMPGYDSPHWTDKYMERQ